MSSDKPSLLRYYGGGLTVTGLWSAQLVQSQSGGQPCTPYLLQLQKHMLSSIGRGKSGQALQT